MYKHEIEFVILKWGMTLDTQTHSFTIFPEILEGYNED